MSLQRVPFVYPLLVTARIVSGGQDQVWDRGIRRADIRKLPFPDSSVEAVYSSHVLEHLYLSDARLVLSEAFRVLRPGGVIRTSVPDALRNARELVDGITDDRFQTPGQRFNHMLLAYPEQRPSRGEALRRAVSGHIHKWQPTAGQLTQILAGAGFADMTECGFRSGKLPDVETIETRAASIQIGAWKPGRT